MKLGGKMNPKISIIVPVYNVEQYLSKCIDSILNQTFKDFELILINDGSTDKSGDICDFYKQKDKRIKVIHKNNEGVAKTRNVGIANANAEYIGFIDSDDWIENDMYEILYKLCIDNNLDIINCSSKIHYPNRTIVNGGHDFRIYDNKEGMKKLLEGEIYDECLWTKLIKKELIAELRFKENMIYEDTEFSYKMFKKAKKIGAIGLAKYNYIKRENSIMDRAIKDINIDAVLIYDEICKDIKMYYPELTFLALYKLANSSMVTLNLICKDNFNINKDKYHKVRKILNKYFKYVIKIEQYPLSVKVLLCSLKIHPYLYRGLIKYAK